MNAIPLCKRKSTYVQRIINCKFKTVHSDNTQVLLATYRVKFPDKAIPMDCFVCGREIQSSNLSPSANDIMHVSDTFLAFFVENRRIRGTGDRQQEASLFETRQGSIMPRRRRISSNTGIITLAVVFTCAMCCTAGIFVNLLGIDPITSTSAPTPLPVDSLQTIIVKTALAAQGQTSAASSPTPSPTLTLTETPASTINIEATSTIFIFEMQTNAAEPTLFVFETNTPFVLATQPPSQGHAVCSCSGDILNCGDFSSQASAQSCFNYCVGQNTGDIHHLDGDNDNYACESYDY